MCPAKYHGFAIFRNIMSQIRPRRRGHEGEDEMEIAEMLTVYHVPVFSSVSEG